MSIPTWTSYQSSGVVESVFTGSEPIEAELDGLPYIAGAVDYKTEFVDVSQSPPVKASKQSTPFTQNKTQINADGIDELVLSGLPDPCTVIWPDGVVTEVTGGRVAWSVDYPGSYAFKLSSPIHLETEVGIEAIPVS